MAAASSRPDAGSRGRRGRRGAVRGASAAARESGIPALRSAMLPRAHRMTDRRHFAETITAGRRAGGPSIVVYVVAHAAAGPGEPPPATAVGFVVSKAVGNSVVRHRVLRQLRAATSARLPLLAGCRSVVVRALPAAAGRTTDQLGSDLDRALLKAARR